VLAVLLCRCADDQMFDGNKLLVAFIVAKVLEAFGLVPLYVLGVTYVDDASPPINASLHMGT